MLALPLCSKTPTQTNKHMDGECNKGLKTGQQAKPSAGLWQVIFRCKHSTLYVEDSVHHGITRLCVQYSKWNRGFRCYTVRYSTWFGQCNCFPLHWLTDSELRYMRYGLKHRLAENIMGRWDLMQYSVNRSKVSSLPPENAKINECILINDPKTHLMTMT